MKDKIITLKNGKEYVVMDECLYNNEKYYIANELIDEEPTPNFLIFKVDNINGKRLMKKVDDEELVKHVCQECDREYFLDDDDIDEILKTEIDDVPLKINQLKLTKYHFRFKDTFPGMPICTSIELVYKYNFEKREFEWIREISHTYISLENSSEKVTDTHKDVLMNANEIVLKIEENELRSLNNNYFTNQEPYKLSYWEINYNTYFKVVGTFNRELNVYKRLCDILDFNKIIDEELSKVNNKKNRVF